MFEAGYRERVNFEEEIGVYVFTLNKKAILHVHMNRVSNNFHGGTGNELSKNINHFSLSTVFNI